MKYMNFHTGVAQGNNLWIINNLGSLMCLNTSNWMCDFWKCDGENIFGVITDNLIQSDNKIFFITQDRNNLFIFDQISNYCSKYSLNGFFDKINHELAGIVYREKQLLIFPKEEKKIIIFNTLDLSIAKKDIKCKNMFGLIVEKENLIYNFSTKDNKISIIDKNYVEHSIIDINSDLECIQQIVNCENGWVILTQHKIQYIDDKFLLIWEQVLPAEYINKYARIFIVDKTIWLLPSIGEKILRYEIKSNSFEVVLQPEDLCYFEKGWGKFISYTENDEFIICANRQSNYIFVVNKKTKDEKWICATFPIEQEAIEFYYKNEKTLFKETDVSLKGLIEWVKIND